MPTITRIEVLSELTECNSNSKKALIEKLLSVLNVWNIRATVYDIRLMIKEVSNTLFLFAVKKGREQQRLQDRRDKIADFIVE